MTSIKHITKKELKSVVGCAGYVIDYLKDCGRLPIIKESQGKGYPTLYHPDSIQIIKDHLAKRSA